MERTLLGVVGLVLLAATMGMIGCFKGDVTIPNVNIGGSGPEPPAVITPANPNSLSDLQRENQQLRDRVGWLQADNRRQSDRVRKYNNDISDLAAEIQKIAAERDKYKRAAGGR